MRKISFAENLKRIREERGISQAQLARELNISYQTYNGYETKGNEPKYDLLIKIANALCVSTDDLLGKKHITVDWFEIHNILKDSGFEVQLNEETIDLRIETTSDEDAKKDICTFQAGTFTKAEVADMIRIFDARLMIYRQPMLADYLADQLLPEMKEGRIR